MKVLVVDDSRATRAILRRMLEALNHEVFEAGDGREALDALAGPAAGAELALVDWNMPVMNGLEFIRAVRETHPRGALDIVMVTTEGDTDHMIAALEAGADEYVMKPFTASVIREKLDLLAASR